MSPFRVFQTYAIKLLMGQNLTDEAIDRLLVRHYVTGHRSLSFEWDKKNIDECEVLIENLSNHRLQCVELYLWYTVHSSFSSLLLLASEYYLLSPFT